VAKDLGEPRDVARSLRHNTRAFGSLLYWCPDQKVKAAISIAASCWNLLWI